jgi:hypothetical protein
VHGIIVFMRTRAYSGNDLRTKSNGQGITTIVRLSIRRWKCQNLGIMVARDKRGKPGNLSVHALFRAADLKFKTRKETVEALNWFAKYNHQLKIDLLVDYAYRGPLKRAYGRSWSCDTQKWKTHKKGEIEGGGTTWATWIHIEQGYSILSEDAVLTEQHWRALPKP